MKFIKTFQLYQEALQVSPSDLPDVKSSKEKLNKLEKNLQEFPIKSKKIDEIYSKFTDPKKIEEEIKKLLGENPDARNPFLVEYQTVSKLKLDIDTMQSKIKKETEELKTADQIKQKQLTESIKKATEELKKKLNDFNKFKKELDDKMKKTDQENKESVKKISSISKKS
jgi:DNA repair exonuclease SbcCD ATPase subunit